VNCLTIDFDIIMAPSIGLYNDCIGDDWSIQGIEKEYPAVPMVLPPDYYLYQYLTSFLIQQFKKMDASKIFFIKSHETAAKLLEGHTGVNLCNIDHHHDVGYENVRARTKIFKPDSGNWIKYLKDKKIIDTYLWVHNSNSTFPIKELTTNYIDADRELKQMDLDNIPEQIDLLIICNSPEWIPSLYQPLWDIWLTIAESWYGAEFEVI